MKPMPATALLKANTDAVARPPMSVTTPQLVARLQSPKNLTANRKMQNTYGFSYHTSATSSSAAASPLPTAPMPLRDQRRLPVWAMHQSFSAPPAMPAIAPPRSGNDE